MDFLKINIDYLDQVVQVCLTFPIKRFVDFLMIEFNESTRRCDLWHLLDAPPLSDPSMNI